MEGADHAAPAGAGYPPTGAALASGYTPTGYPGPSVPHGIILITLSERANYKLMI